MVRALRVLVLAALAGLMLPAVAMAQVPLRVGLYDGNRPWGFRDAQGELVGFEIDLSRKVAASLGMEAVFVPMPFRELFPAVEEGRIDLSACSITVSGERSARFDFTQPYYKTSQGIVVLRRSGIRSLADLAGKAVSVQADSTNAQWLQRNGSTYRLGRIVDVQGMDLALQGLEDGQADAYFGDLPTLLYELLKRHDLAVIARLPTEDQYAMMLAKGSPLTPRVDEAIAALKRDGTLARIHQKWFGSLPEPGSPVSTVLPRP